MPFIAALKPRKNYQFVPLYNKLVEEYIDREGTNAPEKKANGAEITQGELDYLRELIVSYSGREQPNDGKGFLLMPEAYTSTGNAIYSKNSFGNNVPVLREHFTDLAEALSEGPVFIVTLTLDPTQLDVSAKLVADGEITQSTHSRSYEDKTLTDDWNIRYFLDSGSGGISLAAETPSRSRIYYRCYDFGEAPPKQWQLAGVTEPGSLQITLIRQGTAIKINAPEAAAWGGCCQLKICQAGAPVDLPAPLPEIPDKAGNGVVKLGCGYCCDMVANPRNFLQEAMIGFSGLLDTPLAVSFPEFYGLQVVHFISLYSAADVQYGQYNCDTRSEESFDGSGTDEKGATATWQFRYIRRPSGALVRFCVKNGIGRPINSNFEHKLSIKANRELELQFKDDVTHIFSPDGGLWMCSYRKESEYFIVMPPGSGVSRETQGQFYLFGSPVTGTAKFTVSATGVASKVEFLDFYSSRRTAQEPSYDRIGEIRNSSDAADAAGFEFDDFYPTGEAPDFGEMTACFVTDYINTSGQPMGKFVEKQYGSDRRVKGYWNKTGSMLTPAELTDFERVADEYDATFIETVNTVKYGGAGRSNALRRELKQSFAFGERTVAEYRNYGTEDELEARYVYGEDPAGGGYGQLIASCDFNGVWQRFEYDDLGRIAKAVSAYGDTPSDAPEAECRAVLYDYTPLGADEEVMTADSRPRTVVTMTLGVETSRSYFRYWKNESHTIAAAAPGAAHDADGNRVTKSTSYPSGDWEGWAKRSEAPDGTATETSYAKENVTFDSEGGELYELVTTTLSGRLPGHGTREVTRKDYAGNVIGRRTYDIASNLLISGADYSYDNFNRVLTEESIDGDLSETEYNCCGPRFTTDPAGTVTEYAYDVFGRLSFSKQAGVTTFHSYDANNNEISTVLAGAEGGELATGREYDADGLQISDTDAAGATTQYRRGAGWEETVDALGGTQRRDYRADGGLKSISGTATAPQTFTCGVENGECYTEDRASETEWTRSYTDFLGRPYKRVYADGFTETTVYDTFGRVAATVDSCGGRTLQIYDDATGKLKYQVRKRGEIDDEIEWNLDQVIEFEEDYVLDGTAVMHRSRTYSYIGGVRTEVSRSESRRDGKFQLSSGYGRTTTHQTAYGNDGETTETTVNFDGTTMIDSIAEGVRQRSEHSVTGETVYFHDEFNRETGREHEENGEIVSLHLTLDAMGRMLSSTRLDLTTLFTYDALGRKLTETTPGGGATSYTYDPRGKILAVSGGTYRQEYTYDGVGRMTALSTFRDEDHPEVTAFSYDNRGRMTAKTYADESSETTAYRADGRQASHTNVRGQLLASSYDRAGAITGQTSTAGVNRTFTYDANGRVTAVTDSAANYGFTLDDAGNVTSEIGPYARINRSFDALLRPATLSFGNTQLASYGYLNGRLATLTSGTATLSYSYVPGTNRLMKREWSTTSGAFLTQQYAYDAYGRLTAVTANGSAEISYTLDADSRRTAAALPDGSSWNYDYDTKGQLLAANRGSLNAMTYTYDEIGNRLTASEDSTSKAYTANDLNQYTAIGSEVPTYDADGNMLSHDGWTYTWNSENRLIAAAKGTDRLEFGYDYMGRRMFKKVYNATRMTKHEKYVYDGFKLIAIYNGLLGDTLTLSFVWQPTDLDVPLCMIMGRSTYYYITDGNKNVTGLTDSTGARVATYLYGPFGQTLSSTGTLAARNPFRFSSEFHDDETGLVYYNYRYYSPTLGRWTRRDPIGEEGGVNLYGMVQNNSINNIDSLGLKYTASDCLCFYKKAQKIFKEFILWHFSTLVNKITRYDCHAGSVEYQRRFYRDPEAPKGFIVSVSRGGKFYGNSKAEVRGVPVPDLAGLYENPIINYEKTGKWVRYVILHSVAKVSPNKDCEGYSFGIEAFDFLEQSIYPFERFLEEYSLVTNGKSPGYYYVHSPPNDDSLEPGQADALYGTYPFARYIE